MLPSRKERHKSDSSINWASAMFLFGVYWSVYIFTLTNWKNIWSVLFTLGASMGFTAVFDRLKIPITLKWLIAAALCIIGIIISISSLNKV